MNQQNENKFNQLCELAEMCRMEAHPQADAIADRIQLIADHIRWNNLAMASSITKSLEQAFCAFASLREFDPTYAELTAQIVDG